MKRSILSALLVGAVVLWFSVGLKGAFAAKDSSKSSSEKCWVLVERTGLDVKCTVCYAPDELNGAIEALQKDNGERDKANKAAKAEVSKLSSKLAAKKIELGKVSLAGLRRYMEDKGEADANASGRVEMLENILNSYIQ